MTLVLALSYSGRWDITQAAKAIAAEVTTGKLNAEDIDQELIDNYLNLPGILILNC